MTYPYQNKCVISGTSLEFFEYDKLIKAGYSRKPRKQKVKEPTRQLTIFDKPKIKPYKKSRFPIQRTKTNIRRIVQCNNFTKFLTLTFKDHITDLGESNKKFNLFIKRLKYHYPDLKYLAVPEFTKSGRVHYHILLDLQYVKADVLSAIWSHGFIKINRVDKVSNLGVYISKYISKDLMNENTKYKKKFFVSVNCLRPITFFAQKAYLIYNKIKSFSFPVHTAVFNNDYTGNVDFQVFEIKKENLFNFFNSVFKPQLDNI